MQEDIQPNSQRNSISLAEPDVPRESSLLRESSPVENEVSQSEPQETTEAAVRQYTRRPTETAVLSNLRSRTGRTIKLSNKIQNNQASAIVSQAPEPASDTARKRRHDQLKQEISYWSVYHAFASSHSRRHRSDLHLLPEHWGEIRRYLDQEGYKQAAELKVNQLKAKDIFKEVTPPLDRQILLL